MAQRLCCVVVRARAGSIPHGGMLITSRQRFLTLSSLIEGLKYKVTGSIRASERSSFVIRASEQSRLYANLVYLGLLQDVV